jgi:hypothetical protein
MKFLVVQRERERERERELTSPRVNGVSKEVRFDQVGRQALERLQEHDRFIQRILRLTHTHTHTHT